MNEIDVSKCPNYDDEICYNESILVKYCDKCDDCMYKQFHKLKQENDELKKQCASQKGLITIGGKNQMKMLKRIEELEEKLAERINK